MLTTPADRHALVDGLLAEPPVIHPMDASAQPVMGVWSTDEAAYRFIADHCAPGSRTLETGCGLSTVLFTGLGCEHICCTAGQAEADRVLADCEKRGLPTATVQFRVGSSHETLPPLEADGVELDLVLVDGSHAFPLPMLDWFYAGSLLRRGGVLMVDDLELPAVRVLLDYLQRDPRWRELARHRKWGAWEKTQQGTLSEDWTEQPFYVTTQDRVQRFAKRVVGKVRYELDKRRQTRQ